MSTHDGPEPRALRRLVTLVLVPNLVLTAGPVPAAAQDAGSGGPAVPTVDEVLEHAAIALGRDAFGNLKTLFIREQGLSPWVGQGASPEEPVRYRAVVRETALDFGGERFYQRYRSFSGIAGDPTSCSVTVASDSTAFEHDCLDDETTFRPGGGTAAALAGWKALQPLGWVEAAEEAADSARVETGPLGEILLTFVRGGRTRTLHIDPDTWLVERFEGTVRGELGREVVQALEYMDYRDVGGARIPTHIRYLNPGGYGFDLRATEVRVDAPLPDSLFAPPDGAATVEARAPSTGTVGTVVDRLAPEAALIRNVVPTYNVLVVDTGEGLAVFDAPGDAEAAERIIELAESEFPGQAVRWVVPTHFHHDHVVGAPTFVDAGATLLTTAGNLDFFRDLVGRLEGVGSPPIEIVEDGEVLGRGPGRIVLQVADARPHVDEMILPWLPDPRILYQADLFWGGGSARPLEAEARALTRAMDARGLRPSLVVSAHWESVSPEELRRAVGPPVEAFTGQMKSVLYVSDAEAAARFYERVLGFELVEFSEIDGNRYYAEMAAGPARFGLHEPLAAPHDGWVGHQRLYFRVRDLAERHAHVQAAGGSPGPIIETAWMDFFITRDPDGHEVVLAVTDPSRHVIDPWSRPRDRR